MIAVWMKYISFLTRCRRSRSHFEMKSKDRTCAVDSVGRRGRSNGEFGPQAAVEMLIFELEFCFDVGPSSLRTYLVLTFFLLFSLCKGVRPVHMREGFAQYRRRRGRMRMTI